MVNFAQRSGFKDARFQFYQRPGMVFLVLESATGSMNPRVATRPAQAKCLKASVLPRSRSQSYRAMGRRARRHDPHPQSTGMGGSDQPWGNDRPSSLSS